MGSVASEIRRLADEVAELRSRRLLKGTELNESLSIISASLHTLAQRMEAIMRDLEHDPRGPYVPPVPPDRAPWVPPEEPPTPAHRVQPPKRKR